ncbi:phytochelatin synthase family protein [Shewanella violacea]|uniref:glutathione gamma-glutamylcysteinyltransferase n=1 Tax=Shewanella violacea (strain JCM 10179 / CIP 106290 / LMG 19151 / DSS12) TaxID=637905 RepID=D4ZJT6_SHEVD|nr:phytochelatin synthase family protein [Shewanella violacea]BAJ01935.1 phytochelatin synthase family protein [Shewanella violacea DSS12]
MQNKFRTTLVAALVGCVSYLTALPAFAVEVVGWDSKEGIQRLEQSKFKDDFFALATQFQGQENKVYCGVASMSIVLNALRVERLASIIPIDESIIAKEDRTYFPKGNWHPLFHRYTQNTVVALSLKPMLEIMGKPTGIKQEADYGLQLNQMEQLAKNHGLETVAFYITDTDVLPSVKAAMLDALKTEDKYLIVNYSREVMEQAGSGHFSPVVAYHKASDSFLIMDVSNTFQNWVWVDSPTLMKSMALMDGEVPRGLLLVSES